MAITYNKLSTLYEEAITEVVASTDAWTRFLESAGHNYKLGFDDQVLIHAQRPDATAVLAIEDWNGRFGRWVNRGSKGIAVFDDSATRGIRYYFDISDTHAGSYAHNVPIWSVEPRHAEAVTEALLASFADKESGQTSLVDVIDVTSSVLTEDNYPDYLESLMECKSGSTLETLDEASIEYHFKQLLYASMSCALSLRCGQGTGFADISAIDESLPYFDTPETVNALGCAVSDVVQVALREVALTVLDEDRSNRRIETRHNTSDNPTQEQAMDERSQGGNSLSGSRRLSAAEPHSQADITSIAIDVRANETGIPEEEQARTLHEPAHDRQTERPHKRDRQPSESDVGELDQPDSEARAADRGHEEARPDALGGVDEQHTRERARNRDDGVDPPLEELPSVQSQIDLITGADDEKSSAPVALSGDEIDIALGTPIFIGDMEYELLEHDAETVRLFDPTSPLFPREMPKAEFIVKYNENPLNGDASREDREVKAMQQPPKAFRTSAKRTAKPKTIPAEQGMLDLSENFRLTDDGLGTGSHLEKLHYNLNALRVLRELEDEGRSATPEEQEVLSRYVGWGGLAKIFDEDDSSWALEKSTVRARLTEEEYAQARASTLNAHYTSPVIIKAMYEAISKMGFEQGNVLEPACGIGNFFGLVPDSMKEAKLFGVELDTTTARIAKHLYPKAEIRASGFEETDFADNFFDVAIGNVPFGNYSIPDKRYANNSFLIHDYFFARTLDVVRPGGIIAFVTSKGTLDKKNPSVRRYIDERAELIGAIRLPNNAFKGNAGTEVTADIIFLQKRERPRFSESDWVHLGLTANGLPINSYFAENPDMVLGHMTNENSRYGRADDTTCEPFEDESLEDLLKGAITNIHGRIDEYEREEPEEPDDSLVADPNVRNYSYTLVNGKAYFRIDSKMHACELSKTAKNRVEGMIAIRDSLRELIELQSNDASDEEIGKAQARLNILYDGYTKKYGHLNSRANSIAFNQDSSYPLLCALEHLDEERNFIGKADMFTKRTIRAQVTPDKADTAQEALAISLSERGRIDLDYMEGLSDIEKDRLIDDLQNVIYRVPGNEDAPSYQTADEYLSGNIREKLALAEAYAQNDATLNANVEALRAALPENLTASEISVRLGTTWIPTDDIQDFIYELLETPYYSQRKIKVQYSPITGQWNVTGKRVDDTNVKALSTYGTRAANAYTIIENTLNLRKMRIFDYFEDADGKKKAVLNKKETAIALAKQDSIEEAFRDWIFQDPARRDRLVSYYNETFNATRLRTFDGSHLTFPGMNHEIRLRKHQVDAIARILYGGNTLLAHVVGAGKTFEIVAASQELKRIGLASKSLIVVPNHLTEQWAAEYLQLYPAANILVATKRDFERKNRRRFCARIATGDYDAVVIGHSQFEKIPLSQEYQCQMLEAEIAQIVEGIAEMKSVTGQRFTVKQMELTRKKLEARLKKLNEQDKKDDVVTFEELGVDRLFIDESHNYKNLYFYTKMSNVGGVPQTEALKSSDLFMKCRYLDETTGGKGIVFATGTPISNSMVELYTIQRYLQYSLLTKLNLQHFDAWASTFGETVSAIELSPEGTGYRQKTRFAKFYNLPELMGLFRQVADIQTADMLELPTPKVNYHNVSVPPSEFQRELLLELSERADRVRSGMVDATTDNMLVITNDGRKLALDQRLINDALPDYETSKLSVCCDNIYGLWEAHAEKKLTQVVFCDLSTPKKDGTFNVYDDIKAKLIMRGIPEEEIAFIHNAESEAKKTELFGKVRSGAIRVLLGSTQKMGAGTNVQTKLIALHDLDCPWRPSDLEQRLGRIERQGNTNDEVEVFRYVTENTFDAYLYQLVENKQRFISQIMTSKSPVRSAADVDETALSYAELKALATGNPLIKERMDLEVEVSRLKMLKANHLSQKYEHEDKLFKTYPQKIASLSKRIEGYEADVATAEENPPYEKENFSMVVGNVTYTERIEAGAAIIDAMSHMKSPSAVPLGSYRGFVLEIEFDSFMKRYNAILVGDVRHSVELGKDESGNITRIDNGIERIASDLEQAKQMLEDTHKQVENAQAEVDKPFDKEDELKTKSERLAVLDRELDMDNPEQDVIGIECNKELIIRQAKSAPAR